MLCEEFSTMLSELFESWLLLGFIYSEKNCIYFQEVLKCHCYTIAVSDTTQLFAGEADNCLDI